MKTDWQASSGNIKISGVLSTSRKPGISGCRKKRSSNGNVMQMETEEMLEAEKDKYVSLKDI
jgi:hypothetical protein